MARNGLINFEIGSENKLSLDLTNFVKDKFQNKDF